MTRMLELLDTTTNSWTFDVAEQGLGSLGQQDKWCVPWLSRALTNFPYLSIIDALAQIGPDAKPALPRLKELTQYRSENATPSEELYGKLDPDTLAVRKAAGEAVKKIEGGGGVR